MKAIQKELGEDIDSQELDDLRERIEVLKLPEEARQEVDRELRRLERIPRESAEGQVVRTFLETVADLPWSETSEEQLDLPRAEEILERDHYGLQDVKDRVLDFLAVRKLQDENKAHALADETDGEEPEEGGESDEPETHGEDDSKGEQIDSDVPGHADDRSGETLLFVGPPGVGKTSIARSIADAMGRKYVRVSLGGARDEADIRGHRRTYVGAMAGRIIEGLKRAGTKNPVFLLDRSESAT